MEYVIMSDAACDLEPSVMENAKLGLIPMEYVLDNETKEFVPFASPQALKKFYDAQRMGKQATTSQLSPYQYETAWRPWLNRGYSILYLALSSGLSSTCQTADLVGKMLEEQYPGLHVLSIDTKSATGGMGILTERAVRNRADGMDLYENALDLKNAIQHIHHWFLVRDLKYLKKGGRISAATAVVGTALHVRPILEIDSNGKLHNIEKVRSTRKAAHALISLYEENRTDETSDPVYVVDADAPEIGDMLQEKLLANDPSLIIRRCTLSPIIGAHTGPGMAAIIHIGR